MRLIRIITILCLSAASAVSCMMDMDPNMDPVMDEVMNQKVIGKVTDTEDMPIEHIKVTLDWNEGVDVEVMYTDSDGMFTSYVYPGKSSEPQLLTITLEDIDGEEFGGTFSPRSDTMTILEDNKSTINLAFRLNHAIALENSPRF